MSAEDMRSESALMLACVVCSFSFGTAEHFEQAEKVLWIWDFCCLLVLRVRGPGNDQCTRFVCRNVPGANPTVVQNSKILCLRA